MTNHFRLCLDTNEVGEEYSFDKEADALCAFRKHAKRRSVFHAQLMEVDTWGEFVRNVATCDNCETEPENIYGLDGVRQSISER